MDDQREKIGKLLNNDDTKEIVNFLVDLPIADFKFWGGLIKEAYEAKLQEGSGALEALKRKEIQKETEKLKRETENLTHEKNEARNELKKVRKEKDDIQVKLVSIELNPIWVIAHLFPKIRVYSKQNCDIKHFAIKLYTCVGSFAFLGGKK